MIAFAGTGGNRVRPKMNVERGLGMVAHVEHNIQSTEYCFVDGYILYVGLHIYIYIVCIYILHMSQATFHIQVYIYYV